jgi:hypothetical protein
VPKDVREDAFFTPGTDPPEPTSRFDIPLGERGLVVVDSNEHALRVANEPVETGVDGPSFRRRTILVFDL